MEGLPDRRSLLGLDVDDTKFAKTERQNELNEWQLMKEIGHHWSKEEDRGERDLEKEGAHIQGHKPQPSNYSATGLPSCNVCNDLDRSRFGLVGSANTTWEELNSAAQRGCISCFLISKGIFEFCDSSAPEQREIYNIQNIRCIKIDLQQRSTLSLELQFRLPEGSCSIVLELFSASKSCVWPAIQDAVYLPAKLEISRLVMKVQNWMENCNSNHMHCMTSNNPVLPTRVLAVGCQESYDDIKLVLSHGNSAQYVALSYCWGKGEGMIRTTNSTITSWTKAIPWQQLPRTFQDAVKITRELGIGYLWIDALCIIQDDVQDWETESANMANVYSNSYLTIAATSASDCHAGLFLDRWTSSEGKKGVKLSIEARKLSRPYQMPEESIFIRPRLHLAHERFENMENAEDHAEDAPLLTRAWAFQERLLPSRTLHIHAEELIWECKSAVQCECEELDRRHSFEKYGMEGWLKNFVTGELHRNESAAQLGYVWLDLVSEFSALRLTHESDRLPALSGLAYQFSNKTLGSYIAGVWEHDLARGLLFETMESKDNLKFNNSQLSAPSWSWASAYLSGVHRISYSRVLSYGFVQDLRFSFVGLHLRPNSSNPFSWVEHGLLQLKGACAMGTIVSESSTPGEPQDRKVVLEVTGVQKSIPVSQLFMSDGCGLHHDNTLLYWLLVGRETYSGMNGIACEYVLVLQKTSADLCTYKRVGLLLTGNNSWSLRDEPVLTVLII